MQRIVRIMSMYFHTLGLRGCLCWIASRLLNSTRCFTVRRCDCKYPFKVRIPSTDIQVYRQVFIDQGYCLSTAVPPKVIVDAGANIGLASLYLAEKYPGAKIIAIEPERSNFELLKRNTRSCSNIIAVQAALWHRNEDVDLVDPGCGNWAYRTEMKMSTSAFSGSQCHVAAGMTVDRIMREYDIGKIDILKVDIEGAEREVFSDTSVWIDKVDSIIIELHDRFKSGCSTSFYSGLKGFDFEWRQGEHVCVSKKDSLTKAVPEV